MLENIKSLTMVILVACAAFAMLTLLAVAAGFASFTYWQETNGVLGLIVLLWTGIVQGGVWLADMAFGHRIKWGPSSQTTCALQSAFTRVLQEEGAITVMCIIDGELVKAYSVASSADAVPARVKLLAKNFAANINTAMDQRQLLHSVETAAVEQKSRQDAAKPFIDTETW